MDFPKTGLVRLSQIIGDPKSNPPLPPYIPVSKSAWWAGVASGRYPKSRKLSSRVTCWFAEDVRRLAGDPDTEEESLAQRVQP